jgi:hypothetical protein
MRIVLSLVGAVALLPTLALAGPRDNGRVQHHPLHFATGIRWGYPVYRGCYYFNGVNWVVSPFGYGGYFVSRNFVYQGYAVDSDVYPYAIPTANPNVVISPFALNNLVDVTGIPQGARVRDPVSEEIFLRP